MARRREPEWVGRIEDLGVRSFIKLLLAVICLLLLFVFVSILPGIDRLVPGLPITFAAIISAIITIIAVLMLLQVAMKAKAIIQQLRISIPEVAAQSAAVVYWTIILFAVVVTYEGIEAVIVPVAIEAGLLWAYDLGFFLFGLVPLFLVSYHLFHLLDPLADLCISKLRSETSSDSATIQTTLPIKPQTHEDEDSNSRS